jgi:flagellar basal body rod protein FlgG
MDQITINAASGMRSLSESLEIVANNVANAGTAGFKADRELFHLYVSELAEDAASPVATVPVIERNWTDFSQGLVSETGKSLDFALTGDGFFVAQGPNGPLLTRNGELRLSARGVLETQDGYPVQVVDAGGNRRLLTVPPSSRLDVDREGNARIDGQLVGKLDLADVADRGSLLKAGGNYFRLADVNQLKAARAEVHQGKLEASNTGPADSAVRLISVMRHFEMLQKAAILGSEMNRKATEEVARVTG